MGSITSQRPECQLLLVSRGNGADATMVPNGFRPRAGDELGASAAKVIVVNDTTLEPDTDSPAVAGPKAAEEGAIPSVAKAGEDLVVSFAHQYQAVSRIDDEVASYQIRRRRAAEYWELGRLADQLKEEVRHGKWLPFLAKHGYVARTVQRAIHIYLLFQDRQEECAGLTLEQAEQFGKEAKKPKSESQGPRESTGRKGELGVLEPDEPKANPPFSGDAGGEEVHEGDSVVDEYEVKSELLYGILSEAIAPDFTLTDAEREAFATFMAAVGNDGRAVRVLLSRIWTII